MLSDCSLPLHLLSSPSRSYQSSLIPSSQFSRGPDFWLDFVTHLFIQAQLYDCWIETIYGSLVGSLVGTQLKMSCFYCPHLYLLIGMHFCVLLCIEKQNFKNHKA